MSQPSEYDKEIQKVWHRYMTTGGETRSVTRLRPLFKLLPKDPRCKFCNAPFQGLGSPIVQLLFRKRPSSMNPALCNVCETFAHDHQGGAEVEMSMLFADVRGSTTMAEHMSPSAYSQLINRFYEVGTSVLIKSNALIDKLIGDELAAFYVPGFAGKQHARRAVNAAQELLRATGHTDSDGPWLPVGAGVHTGIAFVGSVGSKDGVTDITALGDAVNTAARLASQAAAGEILVSEDASLAAGLDKLSLEGRELELKGRSESVNVHVVRIEPDPSD